MPIKFISMFSGIEAASVAFYPLGWEAMAFAEIEPFPSAVLKHHYPSVPNIGDITKHDWSQHKGQCDLVIGGPPCQAFSVAGLRRSLEDARGNLSLEYIKAIDAIEPQWVITENVPGWLSTKDNAFGCFLAGIVGADAPLISPLERGRWTDAGMVIGSRRAAAWRVLDAQFFGVAQRRRRVFVIASPRNGANPAAVLFERHSLSGDSAPSRKKGEELTEPITAGISKGMRGTEGVDSNWMVMAHGQGNAEIRRDGEPSLTCNHEAPIVAFTQNTRDEVRDLRDCAGALGANEGMKQRTYLAIRTAQTSANGHGIAEDVAHTLDGTQGQAVAVRMREGCAGGGKGPLLSEEQSLTLATANDQTIFKSSTVRRLTPRECERLQGFPDDYTLIPFRGKPAADGPRYKALGNSMAVPVIRWIGERIEAVNGLL